MTATDAPLSYVWYNLAPKSRDLIFSGLYNPPDMKVEKRVQSGENAILYVIE